MDKKCSKCGEIKNLELFAKDKRKKYGCSSHCKECDKEKSAKYRKNNPEKRKETCKNWYIKAKIDGTLGHIKDPEQNRERANMWYQNNKKKAKARIKKWKKENPEKVKIYSSIDVEKRRSVEGSHTVRELENLYIMQNGKCAVCKKILNNEYHKDHILPISKGGDGYINNIQLLCPLCNLEKHAKHPIDFMQEKGYLL